MGSKEGSVGVYHKRWFLRGELHKVWPCASAPAQLTKRKRTMKTSTMSILSVLMLVSGSIALSGCGRRSAANPTTISYSEVGVCKSYNSLTGNEEKAKPNEGFAVFKIETIDNTKQSSSFNLDPERFYVDQTKPEMKSK